MRTGMRTTLRAIHLGLITAAVAGLGCAGGGNTTTDSGRDAARDTAVRPDTSVVDTAVVDTATADSTTDASAADTRVRDTGIDTSVVVDASSDASAQDAGNAQDAGGTDTGASDGGSSDGGVGSGALIITEIMANPAGAVDSDGEWIEVYNPGNSAFSLAGCVLSDNSRSFTFTTGSIAAGAYGTLANWPAGTTTGGFSATASYHTGATSGTTAELILAQSGTTIRLTCNATLVDAVDTHAVSGASMTWPSSAPSAMSFMTRTVPSMASQNDEFSAWCVSGPGTQTLYSTMDYGTPGAANGACP